MEKQESAVEWFFEQLTEVDYGCINKTFLQNNNSLAGHKLRELFNQAKAMEQNNTKKLLEIIMWYDEESDVRPDAEIYNWFKQYYTKTFKSE